MLALGLYMLQYLVVSERCISECETILTRLRVSEHVTFNGHEFWELLLFLRVGDMFVDEQLIEIDLMLAAQSFNSSLLISCNNQVVNDGIN